MKREIAVVGGGLAGFAAALGFAERGFDTVLLAPTAPADARSTALIGPSVELMERIGVWPFLAAKTQAMTTMRIVDDTGSLFRAPTVEFRASEIGRDSLGVNVLNADLLSALREAATTVSDRLEIVEDGAATLDMGEESAILTTRSGQAIEVALVVAADGRNSLIRAATGIEMRTWAYPQSAIVLNFGHERSHDGVSTEFHRRSGPFTQVPMQGRRSSLVWVEEPEIADLVRDLDRAKLGSRIEANMHSMLGAIEVEDGLQVFPISGGHATRLTAPRVALIGEAAHVVPPIGAQGLNLGLRDAAAIVDAAERRRDDPGADEVLRRYESARRVDIATRSAGVDLLNRSLLTDFAPTRIGRTLGLGALAAFGPLRRLAIREGLSPGGGLRHGMRDAWKGARRDGDRASHRNRTA